MSAVLSWSIVVSKLHCKWKYLRINMVDIYCEPAEKISEKNQTNKTNIFGDRSPLVFHD